MAVPPDFVRLQIAAVLDDLGADAIKTGMLGDAATIAVVQAELAGAPAPAARGRSGDGGEGRRRAADRGSRRRAEGRAAAARDAADAQRAGGRGADRPRDRRPRGHGARGRDAARPGRAGGAAEGRPHGGRHRDRPARRPRTASRSSVRRGSRRATPTAPAARWRAPSRPGSRRAWRSAAAVRRARAYVQAAIAAAPGFGAGHGPLGHDVTVDPSRLTGWAPSPGQSPRSPARPDPNP